MSDVLTHWPAAWPAMLAVWAAVAAVHLSSLRRADRWGPERQRVLRAAAFQCGLLTVLLAVASPLAYWSARFIWARSIQELLLGVAAPVLLAAAAAGWVLAGGRRSRPGAAGPDSIAVQPRWWLGSPVAMTVVFNIVWLGWHLPLLYDLAATDSAARYAQYVTYLGAGTLFWLQLIGPARVAPMRRLVLLTGTVAANAILGMVLVFGSGVVYPAYLGNAHHVLGVVADQQVGGAVLWVGMMPALATACVGLVLGWLQQEESDELSRGLERLTRAAAPGGVAWAGRPGFRRPTI